jgi:hypothetical protein
VVPDTSGFRRELQRELEAIERSLRLEIPVGFDVDMAGLRAQLEALDNSQITIPVEIGDGTEIERLRARLQALDNARITIPIDLDLRDIERVDAVLRRLDGRSIRMNARLNGARQVIRDLTAIDALVRRLDGRNITINIDVDAGAAIAQIVAIEAALVGVRASLGSIGSGGGAFGRNSSLLVGAARFVGLLVAASAAAVGLTAVGAGITAAWGAVSAAVAVLPAALATAGLPLALLLADFDELKKRVGALSPAFQQLRKNIAGALAEGLGPALQTLARDVLPKVQTSVTDIARTMGQLAQQAVNWLATTQGTRLLNALLVNVDNTLRSMSVGLGDIGQAFLLLTSQTSTFDVLRSAINEFGASFRANVTQLIGDGTLDRAMRGLRDMLVELGQGFSDLVSNGLEVFAAAAPGVNKFLDSLTKFFNRFNWDSLGRSVGRVFEGLAKALDDVPTETFREIEAAFGRLGDTFNSPAFQKGLTDLINSLPEAIDLVDGLAKSFGPLATEASGVVTGLNDIYESGKKAFDKLDEIGKWIDDNVFGADTSEILPQSPLEKWLRSLFDAELPEDAEEQGRKIREGFERGLEGLNPQFGSVGDGWLPDFDFDFLDLFGTDTGASDFMTDLETEVADGLELVAEAADRGMEDVKLAVQNGLDQLLPIATLALVGMQTMFTNGFLAIGAGVSLAMNTLANTLTLGFVVMQTAVANGMLLLQTAFTTGWALIQLAVDAGLLAMRTAVSEGFLQMQTDATNGMLLFAAAVLAGFALVVPAVTVGMLQIVTAVQIGFQQIVAAVQTGMQQVTAALQLNWGTAVTATQAAMQQMVSAVQLGMSNIAAHTQTGMQEMLAAVSTGMNQMRVEVDRGMSDAEAAVKNGIARMISALRASISQFRDVGAQMGQGLVDGLNSKLGAVQAAAARLAAAAAAAMRIAGEVRSPSRLTTYYGEMMGAGLALGLNRSESEVDRAARSLANTVLDRVSSVQDVFAGDQWATDFSARVNAELASQDVGATGPAQSAKQVSVVNNFYTESSSRESAEVALVQRRQAAMGMFG